MEKIDYENLKKITVETQEELDAIPYDFAGRIYIESDRMITIRKKYLHKVIIKGNSSVIVSGDSVVNVMDTSHIVAQETAYVIAMNNSHVLAKGMSTVEAFNDSSIEAGDNAYVIARDNTHVIAKCNSYVSAWNNSSIKAYGNSNIAVHNSSNVVVRENSVVEAFGNSYIVAFNHSHVVAKSNTRVIARGNSHIKACENSYVEAFDNSYIEACENSNVKAIANAQIMNKQSNGKIQISGNARIVCMPKNINEFLDFYNIKHTDTKAVFYKAVHKTNEKNIFRSDCDSSFKYVIGKTKTEKCNTDITQDCASGIHISHLDWALNFGSDWDDLAIIECETKISDIVMPENTDGKVRTSEVKVLREVPLEECGTYGKILANSKK